MEEVKSNLSELKNSIINKNKKISELVENPSCTLMISEDGKVLEKDDDKRLKLYDKLVDKMSKYKIPIRKDRKYKVRFSPYNKNSYNKLSCI